MTCRKFARFSSNTTRCCLKKIFDASDSGRIYFPADALEAACRERLETLKRKGRCLYRPSFNRNETAKSIVYKLASKGIRVDEKLKLEFPEVFLSRDKIIEMWEAFCNDVYFYSPDSLLYQNAMRDCVRNLLR